MTDKPEQHTEVPKLMLIYLREQEPGLLLSKKRYSQWQDIQAEYEDYMTSLQMTVDRILEFARGDWLLNEDEIVSLREKIEAFLASEETVIPFPKV